MSQVADIHREHLHHDNPLPRTEADLVGSQLLPSLCCHAWGSELAAGNGALWQHP